MISLGLFILATISYATFWVIQFHFRNSIFSNFKNQQWWNPELSQNNKYKEGTFIPKFFGSTTIFVFTTDAFHFFQEIFINSFILSLAIAIDEDKWWLYYLVYRSIFSLVWWLFYDILLNKKK